MRILYIAPCLPYPPDKGERIRAFNLIRHLAQEHTIHVACLLHDPDEVRHIQIVEKYCASVDAVIRNRNRSKVMSALALLGNRPFSLASFYSAELKRRIALKLGSEKIDRIIVFSSVMAQHVPEDSTVPRLIDLSDVDSELWKTYADHHSFPLSWIYRREWKRLNRYEEFLSRTFQQTILISETEAALFRQRVADRPVSVIPSGIDLDYFAPITNGAVRRGHVLLFTGTMDYFPNIDAVEYFCHEILPIVQESCPEIRFQIVGRNPTPSVKRLARHPYVTVTGSVPDIRPYMAEASVMVTPFRIARGILNKVLESMAFGLPVVGTSVSLQGLHEPKASGIGIADDPEEFARQLVTLLQNPEARRQAAFQARHYVHQHHQWAQHVAKLNALLQNPAGAADVNGRLDRG